MRPWSAAKRGLQAALVLACAAGLAEALQDAPAFEITDEGLARIAVEELPLVRETLGVELAKLEVRLGTREEIETALTEENQPLLTPSGGDAERGREQARNFARGLAPSLLAKYCFGRSVVLVQAEGFARLARYVGIPELAGEPALRAVILHELVHAADDELYGLMKLFGHCANTDAVRAANAVIEGHAQLVARDLAPRLGCADGMTTYTRAISAPPAALVASGDTGSQMALRTASSYFTSSYIEGEAFFVALRRSGGEAAVRKAFLEPPADAVLIARPEWFLDPRLRPSTAFELDPALDAFQANFEATDWTRQRLSVSAADLRAALTPLTADEIDALFADVRQIRVQTLTNARTGSQIALSVFEFGAPAEAAAYVAAYERMQRLRDETMKSGAIRILSADYESLSAPDPDGVRIEKRVSAGIIMDVTALCVTRGSLAIDAFASNLPSWDGDRLLAAAVAAFDETLRHPRSASADGAGR